MIGVIDSADGVQEDRTFHMARDIKVHVSDGGQPS